MSSAKAYIIQFGPPDPSDVLETQSSNTISDSVLDIQKEFEQSNSMTQCTLYPAQNPMPRGVGKSSGDKTFFSDSPQNDPDRFDYMRYAYGRGDNGSYGSLLNDHGQLITQKVFQVNNDGSALQDKWDGTGSVVQENQSLSEPLLVVQDIFVSSFIEVEQFAFLLVARPIPYSIKNPVDSDVFIRLSNHGVFPLSSGTVNLYLNNVLQSDLVVEPFFLGNGGLNVTWNNTFEFEYGSQVDVRWVFQDTALPPNITSIEYWFRTVEDKVGPRLLNENPSDDEVGVEVSTSITFDIVDYESGVNINNMEFYVNNILVPIQGNENVTVIVIEDGFRIQHQPSEVFVYGDTIPVVVRITDTSSNDNESFFVWSFTTEGSISPVLVGQDPLPCEVDVERIGNISFEIIDGGHGLRRNSIRMGIDDSTVEDAVIIPIVRRQS